MNDRKRDGFTLIELLIVMAIIGILSAIALPQFAAYRRRSFDARALSDLRNAATGEEAYFSDYQRYVDCVGGPVCQSSLPGFRWSDSVDLGMFQVPAEGATPEYFTGRSFHPKGEHMNIASAYMWNSYLGGLQ